jgi:glycerol-3-phosphate dehydrogenase
VLIPQDHDQKITRSDLLNAMKNMGYEASSDRADGILREVDFGRKGEIDFQDYLDVSHVCLPNRADSGLKV